MDAAALTSSESATVVAAVGLGVLVGEGVVASARGTPGAAAAGWSKTDGHDRERAEQGSAKPSSGERPPESSVHCAVSCFSDRSHYSESGRPWQTRPRTPPTQNGSSAPKSAANAPARGLEISPATGLALAASSQVPAAGSRVLDGEGVVAGACGRTVVPAGRAKAAGHDRERTEHGSAKPSTGERARESPVHSGVPRLFGSRLLERMRTAIASGQLPMAAGKGC